LCENAIDLENDFRGLTRKLNKDIVTENQYKSTLNKTANQYSDSKPFIEESRATHPAWSYRTVEQNRWEHPWINPQDNFEMNFQNNIQTRILEKDHFKRITDR
jgi:hypothetical protein